MYNNYVPNSIEQEAEVYVSVNFKSKEDADKAASLVKPIRKEDFVTKTKQKIGFVENFKTPEDKERYNVFSSFKMTSTTSYYEPNSQWYLAFRATCKKDIPYYPGCEASETCPPESGHFKEYDYWTEDGLKKYFEEYIQYLGIKNITEYEYDIEIEDEYTLWEKLEKEMENYNQYEDEGRYNTFWDGER